MKKDSLKLIAVATALCGTIFVSNVYNNLQPKQGKKNVTVQTTTESPSPDAEISKKSSAKTSKDEKNGTDSKKNPGPKHLRDVDSLYEDNGNSYVTMYLTVRKGNATEGTDHTWEEVNSHSVYYYEDLGIPRYKVEGLLQVGDETGPLPGQLGYEKTVPNATVQIRGQTSSTDAQKNYKIELKPNQGSWNGQTTISLNKHISEGLRFRNKLGFDLLSGINQLMSLRTTFVHLYVKDLTAGNSAEFQDYGLYTQVEQLNKRALRTHHLDKNGQLYKANFFEFYRYNDVIKLPDDPDYDETQFEKYLEIKGNKDSSKLIAMLEDVNDFTMPIEEVIQKHFDTENLTYWLAFNLLTGNVDTINRNFYLYSAKNEKIWYLYPWDLDDMFRYDENELKGSNDYSSWERGVSNYWSNVLFQRCLKSASFRKQLDLAVNDLRQYLSKDRLAGLIKEYREVTDHFVYRDPDKIYNPLNQKEYDEVASKLPLLVDHNYEFYKESLKKPLPFYIGTPETNKNDGTLKVMWDASYDFQEENLTYTAVLSKNPDGSDVLGQYTGEWTQTNMPLPEPGQYFLKVYATNESGFSQDAFDIYAIDSQKKYYGTICFYVNSDGTIGRYTTEN